MSIKLSVRRSLSSYLRPEGSIPAHAARAWLQLWQPGARRHMHSFFHMQPVHTHFITPVACPFSQLSRSGPPPLLWLPASYDCMDPVLPFSTFVAPAEGTNLVYSLPADLTMCPVITCVIYLHLTICPMITDGDVMPTDLTSWPVTTSIICLKVSLFPSFAARVLAPVHVYGPVTSLLCRII